MGFIQDFKEFAFKGNLIDMAVGIIMGTASAAIVKSFIDNIIAPCLAYFSGSADMSGLTYKLGEADIKYGLFIQQVIDFTIMALVIFIALKIASRWMKKAEEESGPSEEVKLLTEIRDSLAK